MNKNSQNTTPENANTVRLDDESRVKVLSPSMMVFKRFMRNKLAITGLVILIAMFLFSFAGVVLTPYHQSQTFYKYESIPKNYANLAVNEELRYSVGEGERFTLGARTQFILALNNKKDLFIADGETYTYEAIGENSYLISGSEVIGTAMGLRGSFAYTGAGFTDEITAAFELAQQAGENEFTLGDDAYKATKTGKSFTITRGRDVALASLNIFDAYDLSDEPITTNLAFRVAVEEALATDADTFTLDGTDYRLEGEDENATVYTEKAGTETEFAIVSRMLSSATATDVRITVAFKDAALEAIAEGRKEFTFPGADGTEIVYTISAGNNTYTIKTETLSQLVDTNAPPSKEHWLGTDLNGMDMLTRLMYGGRISLLVGFVVVFIELFIGVIIGGVSGYFGAWIDTLLMRFIDLFNCIPSYPLMIIAGSVMDAMDVSPTARIFLLMFILGVLGWTGIARTVRGQILSLREQDFMVAAEATGIKVTRRIFRHLVPNVMPLLIVNATMSLGGIIITEATLSFLGLGLKYPMASWGTIINAATDIFVMTNYWFIWIPAGLLILLTVLGFNFVGDGLRDAFDPKMKR